MIIINLVIKKAMFLLIMLFISNLSETFASVYTFSNKDKAMTLTYSVDFSDNKMSINVSTLKSKHAYSFSGTADYQGKPKVDFIDLNGDGFEDIILKLSDEEGYFPFILLNEKNEKFTLGMKYQCCIYYDPTRDYFMEGLENNEKPEQEYFLKDINSGKEKELIFKYMGLKHEIYKNVIFRLSKDKKEYFLYSKTKYEEQHN